MIGTNEVWRAVVDYEGWYEVSNQGRVRSVERSIPCVNRWGAYMRRFPSVILAQAVSNQGYLRVNLSIQGMAGRRSLHVLVAQAFIGPRPPGLQVCHNDGDKANNTAGNLRYDTASANVRDCVKHGTQSCARKTECPQGHSYTAENTGLVKTRSGLGRVCRTCRRERARADRRKVNAGGPTAQ